MYEISCSRSLSDLISHMREIRSDRLLASLLERNGDESAKSGDRAIRARARSTDPDRDCPGRGEADRGAWPRRLGPCQTQGRAPTRRERAEPSAEQGRARAGHP